MARSSRRTASTTAAAAGVSRKAPAKKRKSSQLSEEEGGAKAKKKDWRKYKKKCSADGCTNHVQKGGVCIRHGAKVTRKLCSKEGCKNIAVAGGVCRRHGAKVKLCSSEGCTNKAREGGVCKRHGAKVKLCSSEGCTKFAQAGGVCMKHGAKVKQCSKEGCTNGAQTGGVCVKHGAKLKRCSNDGCSNNALKGGVCWSHGEKPKCSDPECNNLALDRGVCWSHGAKDKIKLCRSDGCSNIGKRKGGLCFKHWTKKHRSEESTTEQAAVAVPALPPIDLQPSETECVICFDAYNVSEMVTCAAESACSCVVCHDCLVTCFSSPWKMVNGQLIEYDPTQCPACRKVGAFSLDEIDAAIVYREMNEMYRFEAASVGASDASTSHEQGDSEWQMGDE
eukprot:scaffold37098_cov139-Skeletonema_dohrnii-CCMP3373.AAC.1